MSVKPYKERIEAALSDSREWFEDSAETANKEGVLQGYPMHKDYWEDMPDTCVRLFREAHLNPRYVESWVFLTQRFAEIHYGKAQPSARWKSGLQIKLVRAIDELRQKKLGLTDEQLCTRLMHRAGRTILKKIDPSEKLSASVEKTKNGAALYRQYLYGKQQEKANLR